MCSLIKVLLIKKKTILDVGRHAEMKFPEVCDVITQRR
jgi:hypothetical protein